MKQARYREEGKDPESESEEIRVQGKSLSGISVKLIVQWKKELDIVPTVFRHVLKPDTDTC